MKHLIIFIFALLSIFRAEAQFVKKPHLFYLNNPSTMLLSFQMKKPQVVLVSYGITKEYELAAAQISQQKQGKNENIFNYTFKYLQAGKTYFYKITNNKGSFVFESKFTAVKSANDRKVYFSVMSNNANKLKKNELVAKNILSKIKDNNKYRSFVLHTGNIIKKKSTEESLQNDFFNTKRQNLSNLQAQVPFMLASGANKNSPNSLVYKYFSYNFYQHSSLYYSFNYGSVTVCVLDEFAGYEPKSSQYIWLQNTLEANANNLKVVLVNAALNKHGRRRKYATDFQQSIQPLLAEKGVEVVFYQANRKYKSTNLQNVNYFGIGRNSFISVELLGNNIKVIAQNTKGQSLETKEFTMSNNENTTNQQKGKDKAK